MTKPPILSIAPHISDLAEPADFPKADIRFRNDRWAEQVGLGGLSDADWAAHFARFDPLPGNLEVPLALRYHGHQFHNYNPDLGDGRGFLFAQVQDQTGRWLDLGTKGSGQTRWSRQGDGRLTLKGGVREILASAYLEAFGVKTSKAFSLIETGEPLHRNDEPSPTRSSVLVRLSHSHLRFGSFQRFAFLEDRDGLAALVQHCAETYFPGCVDADTATMTARLFEAMMRETARMIGQWMPCGFVHGVMNTDNFNITGETFDFGPWRFLDKSDPNFVAAYFDHQGLYRFGRQPAQGLWALQQLGGALTVLAPAEALSEALGGFEAVYQAAFAAHTHALLGVEPTGALDDDIGLVQALFSWLTDSQANWAGTFYDWFGGAAGLARVQASPRAALYSGEGFDAFGERLLARTPERPERLNHAYFQQAGPVSLVIDEVEALWAPIAEADDWSGFERVMAQIEAARGAYDIGFEA